METVRLRFPPSPTGYFAYRGARTALFNWLYAKKHNGKLVLRIEDTDVERSTQENVTEILDGLQWLGIDWDEGPYNQTEYAEEHRKTAEQLLESGFAYRCFCTKEELEARKEEARKKKLSLGLRRALPVQRIGFRFSGESRKRRAFRHPVQGAPGRGKGHV